MVDYKVILDTLSHAPYHSDDKPRGSPGTLPAQRCQESQAGNYLLLGVVTYRTGVEKHCISLVDIIGKVVSDGGHH